MDLHAALGPVKGGCTCVQLVVLRGDSFSPLGHHALHPVGLLGVVETEEARLAETQHTAWKRPRIGGVRMELVLLIPLVQNQEVLITSHWYSTRKYSSHTEPGSTHHIP